MDTPQAPTADLLDVPFSQLFGAAEQNVSPTTAAPQAPETPQATPAPSADQPQATPAPATAPQSTSQTLPQAFELKTRTGTVYRSIEDAVTGIEHKDTLINQLRNFALERTGVDPLTGQQIVPQPQYQQMQPQGQQMQNAPNNYLQNPDKYFQDLYSAYTNNDPKSYFATQQKLIDEKLEANYAPVMPVLQQFAKNSAVDQVNNALPEFRNFFNSPNYRDTLQAFPALAQAIAVSENKFEYAQQLPDLYKMVYQLNQARTLPELIKQQQAAIPPQPAPRPTAAPTHVAPPQTATIPRNANLTDADARKTVIEAFERSGKADMRWKS
jgi:hypothetical protein